MRLSLHSAFNTQTCCYIWFIHEHHHTTSSRYETSTQHMRHKDMKLKGDLIQVLNTVQEALITWLQDGNCTTISDHLVSIVRPRHRRNKIHIIQSPLPVPKTSCQAVLLFLKGSLWLRYANKYWNGARKNSPNIDQAASCSFSRKMSGLFLFVFAACMTFVEFGC